MRLNQPILRFVDCLSRGLYPFRLRSILLIHQRHKLSARISPVSFFGGTPLKMKTYPSILMTANHFSLKQYLSQSKNLVLLFTGFFAVSY
jgi:hypothetical protein